MKEVIIRLENVGKTFRRYQREEGIAGSIKSLIHRKYECKEAIVNCNLTIREGEFVGLIGPNGAGKTTLIKMMTGIIRNSTGTIRILGYTPWKLENDFKMQYAVVMGQKSQLLFELTTNDMLKLMKVIYEISHEEFEQRKNALAELFDVKHLLGVQVRTLSLGERMKMELLVALIHQPKVLFLDEPTIGLDVIGSKQMRLLLKKLNEEYGQTILLTSHYMEDIKELCKRSVVVHNGQVIFDGRTDQLFEEYQKVKEITMIFEKETLFAVPKEAEVLEKSAFKVVVKMPKELVGNCIQEWITTYHPVDLWIKEEEIEQTVREIYRMGERLQ